MSKAPGAMLAESGGAGGQARCKNGRGHFCDGRPLRWDRVRGGGIERDCAKEASAERTARGGEEKEMMRRGACGGKDEACGGKDEACGRGGLCQRGF